MRLKDWKTIPIFSLRKRANAASFISVVLIPSISSVPAFTVSIPARMPSSVDLPDPDGPVSAIQLPRSILKDTPLKMWICSPANGSDRVIF
jgi:hypothetical protein